MELGMRMNGPTVITVCCTGVSDVLRHWGNGLCGVTSDKREGWYRRLVV